MTQEAAILSLLRAGPKTTSDFCASLYHLSSEYRRAISTLRKKGYDIRAARMRQGEWEYRLTAEPTKVEPSGQLVLSLA
jgi:hypothetical protein